MKLLKRILPFTLTLSMLLSLVPTSVFAAENVTTVPGSSTLNVEYFNSTLYNWNEDDANAATAAADVSTGYTATTVAYSTVASSNNNNYTSTSYYYLMNGTYYSVYYTRSKSGKNTTYTLYYLNGSTYNQIGSTTNGYDTVTLYTNGGYEGKGLYFTNGSNKQNYPAFSNWANDDQNWKIYSGLAESVLKNSDNVPFNNDTVNAAPLFATDGSNTDYTEVYTNVGVPFVYDSSTGYYTLDSDTYGVYFSDGTGASNTNMLNADKPSAYNSQTGFFPFNSLSSSTVSATKGTESGSIDSYVINGSTVFGFGMVTSVNFTMTENGQIEDTNGDLKDIIFEFAGDDDVWVYIDNTLVLDIGGTHDAITGTINFNSGAITLTAGAYSSIADLAGTYTNVSGNTMSQGNLYSDKLNTNLDSFSSNGIHTLTIYYMERGRGRSNCKIKFNLPQTDTVNVTKELRTTDSQGTALTDEELKTDFTFTLYKNGSIVTNTNYIVQNANGVIDSKGNTGSDGTFTLKGGQTAVFDLSLDGSRTYYVVETNPYDNSDDDTYYDDPTWSYSSNISNTTYTSTNSSAWYSNTANLTGSKDTAESLTFICTNTKGYISKVNVNAVDDVVVIDYNLPVTVDVLDNDEIIGDVTNLEITTGGTYGQSEVTDDNDITYTLKNVLSSVDSVKYNVTAKDTNDGETTASDDATLNVVPANSVYYEDDFATSSSDGVVGITYTGNWTTVSGDTNSTSTSQSSENVIYGTDAAYADDTTYSNGTASKAQSGATATFTFKGTGVDIYSSTDNDACIVYAYLYKGEDTSGTMVQYAAANNHADDGKYYVVPTVTFEGLDYDTYTIKLRVVSTDSSAVNYYLDGIRVYNPLGTVTNDGSVACSAYAAADELNAVFTEIRTMLLDEDSLAIIDSSDSNGMLFIDEITSSTTGETTTELTTYESVGPEHEVYLANGNAVAFTLDNFADGDAVYVGIKLSGIDNQGNAITTGTVEVTNGDGKSDITITSTTDQYYKITPDANGNVVIKNTSENNAIISLTKVRTTSPETNDISFVSNASTVEYTLTTFSTLSLTAYESEVIEDDTDVNTDIEVDEETDTGDVEIDNTSDIEETDTSSQSTFNNIINKIINWFTGKR